MDKESGKRVIDEVLSRIDIVELISEHVVLKKSGSGYSGRCPFHDEKTPSFHVSPDKQIFRCFGCGVGGNIFEFYKRFFNLSFGQALRELADKAGVKLDNNYSKEKYQEKEEKRKSIYDIYKTTLEFYKWNLEHEEFGKIAREYLNNRHVSKPMIEQFSIGYAQNSWDSLHIYLQKKGFTKDEIKESGLVVERSDGGFYDRFRHRVIFPIQNEKGEVIAFGGRALDDNQKAKYINSPETEIYTKGQHLYGLNFAKNSIRDKDQVIIVEGYLDVISCHEAGFENCVASLGTALTSEQAKKLLRYTPSKKVIVAYDSDSAGQRAAEKGTEILEDVAKGTGIQIYVLQIPSGKDPDEFLHSEGGHSEFQKIIDRSKPIIEFQIEKALYESDLVTPEGKTFAVDKCVNILMKIKNDIYRNEMIKKVVNWYHNGQRLGIREEDLRRRLKIFNYSTDNQNNSNYETYQQSSNNYYNNSKYSNNKYNSGNNYNSGNYNKKPFGKYNKYSRNNYYEDYQKRQLSEKALADFEKIPAPIEAEKGIIYFLVERSKAIDYIKTKLENIVFQDHINEQIKYKIFEKALTGNPPTWQDLLTIFPDSEEHLRVVEIWEGFSKVDISQDKILKDYLKQIKLQFIKNQRDEVKSDIDEAARNGQSDMIPSLMGIYKDLQIQIKQLEKQMFSR